MSVIQAAGLVKRYGRGRTAKTALAGLDLAVEEGEVFGYLGPNGAGKSTTIRLMLDFIRPTGGNIRVFGADPHDNASVRRRIGYLAGDFVANGKQTGRELLTSSATCGAGCRPSACRSWPTGSTWTCRAGSAPCPRATGRRSG